MRLEVRLAPEGRDALAVVYRFHNDRVSPVEVLDTLLRIERSGASAPDPDLAYVVPEGADGAAVGKYLVAEPEDQDVEAPEVVLARRLGAGAALQGRMLLPLPLRLYHPYVPAPAEGSRRIRSLRVLVGFIDTARVPPDRPVFRPHPGHANFAIPVFGNAFPLQEFVSVTVDVGGMAIQAAW